MPELIHKPVLLRESIEALNIRPDGVYVDGTLGRAGHSIEIAQRLTTGRLICVDRDQAAIDSAQERLAPWMDRVTLVHRNFCELGEILKEAGVSGADGMLFDLGVSSPQLDDPARGFSYMHDAPLDMRMDESQPLSAHNVVNEWDFEDLRRILYDYGEERYAPRIARAIVEAREEKTIQTTGQLVEIIKSAMPAPALREKPAPGKAQFSGHPHCGKRRTGCPAAHAGGGNRRTEPRAEGLAVITFQSLEDRIVKKTMRELATGCICPPEFPVCVCGRKPKLTLVTRKPIVSGEEELKENPRARSAQAACGRRNAIIFDI
jgi:16S rRNA (cytosine1402-N4)-methyltransferase